MEKLKPITLLLQPNLELLQKENLPYCLILLKPTCLFFAFAYSYYLVK